MTPFVVEIRRLLLVLLLLLVMVGVVSAYWVVAGAETILQREDNPRLFVAEAQIVRGEIYDRDDNILVRSIPDENDWIFREYVDPSIYSVMGYYSLRYGVGGVESAYDSILRGDTLPDDLGRYFDEEVLHLARRGSDVRLSLDLALQEAVAGVMESRQGAAVILSVPDGAVLAMVSQPAVDPHILDEKWEDLVEAEGDPFFNRALQGKYQPGGSIYPILLAAAVLEGGALDQVYENANEPVMLDDVEVGCAIPTEETALTLAEAHRLGCPSPFVQMIDEIGVEAISRVVSLFLPQPPLTLPGFNAEAEAPEAALPELSVADLMGQGSVTLSPLEMAAMMATFINNGNIPQPHLLEATRAPDENWVRQSNLQRTYPAITTQAAQRVRTVMRQTDGAAALQLGEHTALAYSGEDNPTWFTGFAYVGSGRGIVVTLVLEQNADLEETEALGLRILDDAVQYGIE